MSRGDDLDERLKEAIRHFWTVRGSQAALREGKENEAKNRSGRDAVTGGKQMDGFTGLVHDLLVKAGLEASMVFCSTRSGEDDVGEQPQPKPSKKPKKADGPQLTQTQLPGWFRAEKDWDLLVIVNGAVVAAIEFKTQVGSFGNNFNNRTEEALGNAADLKAAYREGAFRPSLRPWLGYLRLLEDSPKSTRPVKPVQPHFKVFPEFQGASYARRYDILLTKLVREELYDAACLLLSPQVGGLQGEHQEINPELSFRNFIASLVGHASAIARLHPAPATSAQPETRTETQQE